MATYYVSTTGSNSNPGTAASPWLTRGKVFNAGSAVVAGDTVVFAPGVYREATITCVIGGSSGTPITIVGDVDGSLFRAAGISNPAVGEVVFTAFVTSDTTQAGTSTFWNMGGQSYLTFKYIHFIGSRSTNYTIDCTTTPGSRGLTFQNCLLQGTANTTVLSMTGVANTPLDLTVDSCIIVGIGTCILVTMPVGTAEYNANVYVKNSFLWALGSIGFSLMSSGTAADHVFAYGATVESCTIFAGGGYGIRGYTGVTNLMTNTPVTVKGCIICGSPCFNAGLVGYIVEDYNHLFGQQMRTNTAAGTHSQDSEKYCTLLSFGQEALWGANTRQVLTPTANSPMLGFGAGTTTQATDFLGRARPSGGQITPAVGYLERHNTAAQETTIVQASTSSIKIAGPGNQEYKVAVDAVSTTISVYAYADANHGSANPPQVQLMADGELNITGQTVTMTANTGAWNQVTLSPFTPSQKGYVKLRFISRSAAANGNAYFDSASIS